MSEPTSIASLGPSLLARKGGARPAMRTQLAAVVSAPATFAAAVQGEDDLGWNDMGFDRDAGEGAALLPEIVRQQRGLSHRIARERRSALEDGRRAAFTLRVDAERHLKLRLACTLRNRSAQQLVTEALDRLLADLPDVADLAAHVARRNAK